MPLHRLVAIGAGIAVTLILGLVIAGYVLTAR